MLLEWEKYENLSFGFYKNNEKLQAGYRCFAGRACASGGAGCKSEQAFRGSGMPVHRDTTKNAYFKFMEIADYPCFLKQSLLILVVIFDG